MEVRILRDDQGDLWNRFLSDFAVRSMSRVEGDTFSCGDFDHHAWAWQWRRVVAETFGHRPYYLAAFAASTGRNQFGDEANGEIIGILPLFYVKSLLFGNSLISVPYLNAGGILAYNVSAFQALLAKAHSLASEFKVGYVELRSRCVYDSTVCSLPARSHKVSMVLPLLPDAEELFKSFPAKLRSQVRRPTKSGVDARVFGYSEGVTSSGVVSPDLGKGLRDFYYVFSRNMRDLGTPVYPQKFFYNVLKAFPSRARIVVAYFENVPVASGLTLGVSNIVGGDANKTNMVEIPWASSLRSHNKLSPNMLLYWEAIKQACEDGYSHFDFGRSSEGSGTYRFKEQWGAAPKKLHWYYDVLEGHMPDVNPNNPKYSLLIASWKRLPLAIANLVGPRLTRGLP